MSWDRAGMPEPAMDPPPDGPIADGFANPDATTPYPTPTSATRPSGYWESAVWHPSWAISGSTWTAPWASPILDLRPDLRGVNSRDFYGTPINRVSGVQMWIAISGLDHDHRGMTGLMSQWGHPVDGDRVKQFVAPTDITGDLSNGQDLAILDYFPPGSGYQMRYWQVKIRFLFPLGFVPAALPRLQLQAGIY